jgi:multimeric flavodoxin WrbA
MLPLYEQITSADLLVLATPVYWYGPTALMKAFIDRFVYFNCPEHRLSVQGKKALVAVVLEEDNEATWEPVVHFFDQSLGYLEMKRAGTVVVGGVGPAGAIRQKPDRLNEAFELGRNAVQAP